MKKTKRGTERNLNLKDICDVSVGIDTFGGMTMTLTQSWKPGNKQCAKIRIKLDDWMALAIAKSLAKTFKERSKRASDDAAEIAKAAK